MPPRVLIAPDSFKGTFTAEQVSKALARGLVRAGVKQVELCPLADGGEGSMEVLAAHCGGELRSVQAADPLGRVRTARYAWIADGERAIVEMAEASGLRLLGDGEQDAFAASSKGTGQLIAAAVNAGARVIYVCVGGSASTDGGSGAVEAMMEAGGLRKAKLVVLCDVNVAFERAAEVFAPSKGADAATVQALSARLEQVAVKLPRDPRGVPMTGCGGGLSGGLWATFDAVLTSGAQWICAAVGLGERLRRADCVVTGEGRLDAQTLKGKVVSEVAALAARAGVPAYAVVGEDALCEAGKRELCLRFVIEAGSAPSIEAAGEGLAAALRRSVGAA